MLDPNKIAYRHKLDFAKQCKAQFRTHWEAHDELLQTNTMVNCTTLAIIIGPTENLEGTNKFFSLTTGKKIKQRKLRTYPMPNSIIKKVEQYGQYNAMPNIFNFSHRNGVLFEWNNNAKKSPKGLVKDDVVLYLPLMAEIFGIIFDQDQPNLLIEDKTEPQGLAKYAAARNTNLEPFDITAVDAPMIIRAKDDEVEDIDDDNTGILSIKTIPQNNNHNPLVLPGMSGDYDNEDDNNNDPSKDEPPQGVNQGAHYEVEIDKPGEDQIEGQDQEVCQSKRMNK